MYLISNLDYFSFSTGELSSTLAWSKFMFWLNLVKALKAVNFVPFNIDFFFLLDLNNSFAVSILLFLSNI